MSIARSWKTRAHLGVVFRYANALLVSNLVLSGAVHCLLGSSRKQAKVPACFAER